MAAQIEIVNFACYYGAGAKTIHSDKVWMNVRINGTLVSAWGKRGGRLSFKTRAGAAGNCAAEAKWAEKIGGRKDNGDVYTIVSNPGLRMALAPTLSTDLVAHYYSKLGKGQVRKG